MSIVRTEHNKSNPYVVLNKSALEDPKLSWGAKGLWAYLMSRPDNWNVSVTHLVKTFQTGERGCGEKAIYKLLNELIENGYCHRKQEKAENGKFLSTEYTIHEKQEIQIILPQPPERRAVEGPHPVPLERDAVQGEAVSQVPIYNTLISNDLNKYCSEPENPDSKQKKELSFNRSTGKFQDISQEDFETFKKCYPNVDIEIQILKAEGWIKDNPSKSKKTLWRKFLTGWLERAEQKAYNQKGWQEAKTQQSPNKGQNSREEQNKQNTLKRFKHGQSYAGATFWTTDAAMAFTRGQTTYQLAYKEYSFDSQLQGILLKLGIV